MLTLFKNETKVETSIDDLQDLMQYMIKYGKPRISYISNGWYCGVEMNTNTAGSSFEVKSEFGHPTPMAAAKQCHERILNAIKAITK